MRGVKVKAREKTFILKALLTEAINPNSVFGPSERNGLLFEKKNISLSCIQTQRNSRFDFSFNDPTYMLCAPQISLKMMGGNKGGH